MSNSDATRLERLARDRPLVQLDQERAAELERGQIVYVCGHAVRVLAVTKYPIAAGGRCYITIAPKVYGLDLWRAWEVRIEPMPDPNTISTTRG